MKSNLVFLASFFFAHAAGLAKYAIYTARRVFFFGRVNETSIFASDVQG